MTERLARLLHDEADALAVPPAPVPDVLARGRGLRTRRRVTTGVAAVAVLAVVGAGLGLTLGRGDERAVDPVAPPTSAPDYGAVFSIGTDVYLDGGAVRATIDDGAVKSLFYTSAGVLVRHGENPYSDGGGPQRFSLVTPDGEVRTVSVQTEEAYHSTDPAQPLLFWAETVDGEVQVVVHDVVEDREVARVPVPGARSDFLPLSASGDRVWLQAGESAFVVDWRTGEVTSDDAAFDHGDVSGGRAVSGREDESVVVDVDTGEDLLRVDTADFAWLELSPDGRFAKVFEEDPEDPDGSTTTVYDVETGESAEVPGGGYNWGWTSTGDLVTVEDDGTVTTCDTTGDCTSETPELRVLPNALGGASSLECQDVEGGTVCSDGAESFDDDLVLGGVRRES